MTGILPKWSRDAGVDSAPCEASASIQSTKLRRSELRMVFLVMLVSYGSACAVLVLELVLWWLVRRCRRARGQSHSAPGLSGVRHVVVKARGDSTIKTAWMEPDAWTPGHKSSGWAAPLTDRQRETKPRGLSSPSSDAPSDRRPPAVRGDREVLRDMRASVKRINGRPYMFVRTGDALRPVPVTEDRGELLMNIFRRLKRQPRDRQHVD